MEGEVDDRLALELERDKTVSPLISALVLAVEKEAIKIFSLRKT
jgi:hypothetical protein